MSQQRTSLSPMRMSRMLDIACVSVDTRRHACRPPCPAGQAKPQTGHPNLSRKNPASMRVSGQFLPAGQMGHGFFVVARAVHFSPSETHHPRAPGGAWRLAARKLENPLSLLSLLHESEYPWGLCPDFAGTRGLSRACPDCPALLPCNSARAPEKIGGSFRAFIHAGPFELVVIPE